MQPCAGGIVFDEHRRLLLVRRARDPGAGAWSIPGGRCRPGEPPAQACVREVREETGLAVRVVRLAGSVVRDGPQARYAIDDFLCELLGGTAAAGDDADALCWASRADLDALPLVAGLLEALTAWQLLPN